MDSLVTDTSTNTTNIVTLSGGQAAAVTAANSVIPTTIPFLTFFALFTPTEQAAILAAFQSGDTIIMGFVVQASGAGGMINLLDPRVIDGVNYLTTTSPPILTSGNAALILSGQPSL
jgi:hypothetical protein